MVTCNLVGRLGNQMFIIAATAAYGMKHNMSFYIPVQSKDPSKWPCYFPNLCSSPPQHNNFFEYKEQGHHYQEIPYYPNIRLDGYFQSEKYIAMCRQPIIQMFGIPWKKKEGIVSIHVRRGDYLSLAGKHPVITEEYLSNAIAYFLNHGYSKFEFFSDDMGWCRTFAIKYHNSYGYIHDMEFVTNDSKSELEDLSAMSSCASHIISNSSFSWWAAWLNQNPNKKVIAPKTWFGCELSHLDTKDICPDTWIRI